MSSTGDELSDAESQPRSSTNGEAAARHNPPPSAQVASQLPSSPPAGVGASRDEARDAEDESSEGDSDRENRFEGPASTWRKYIADERQLATSLDQERANDLSIHLYNAHALKSRLYDQDAASAAKPWSSKQRWVGREEYGTVPWHPDRNWTAWPLPANEVPRKEEVFGVPSTSSGDEGRTYRKATPWVPSADLQEELQALMLRKAKERFRRRRWDVGSDDAEGRVTSNGPNAEDDVEAGAERSSSDHEPSDLEADAEEIKPRVLPEQHYLQPALLADDDQANAILQPSVRHILTKFDDLLIGLHKSRQGHRRAAFASRSQSRASASRSRSRSAAPLKRSRSRSRSKGKQKAASSEDEGSNVGADDESADGSEADASPSSAKKTHSASGTNNHNLGLRDWSEVLGVAALVGWDQAIIDRAAKRCASLFREGMSFRTMPETSAEHVDDRVAHYVPDMVPPLESESDSEAYEVEVAEKQQWFCPYDGCARHHEAYEKAWRWREHLRRAHKLSVEQVEEVERSLGNGKDARQGAEASASGADEEVGDEDGGEEGTPDSGAGEEMVGGVHTDGFLQPITTNLERGRDAKPRRRRSTNGRKGSKRRRIEEEDTGSPQ